MIIKWELIKEKFWKRIIIERTNNRNYQESLCLFLQISDKVNIQCNDYEGIKSDYGIFLFSNNKIHNYLLKMESDLTGKTDFEAIIFRELCSFVYQCFTNVSGGDNWEIKINDYFSQHYSRSFLREMKTRIDIKQLAENCANSKFNLYDKSRWYRNIMYF